MDNLVKNIISIHPLIILSIGLFYLILGIGKKSFSSPFYLSVVLFFLFFSVLLASYANESKNFLEVVTEYFTNPSRYKEMNVILNSLTIFLIIVLTLTFSSELLPRLTERNIHLTTLVFMYLLIIMLPNPLDNTFFLMALAMSILIFTNAMVNYPMHSIVKIILYTYYIFMLLSFEVISFIRLSEGEYQEYNTFVLVFYSIGGGIYLIAYTINIYRIIPLQDKNETYQEMRKRVTEQSNLFIEKTSDEQADYFYTALLTLLFMVFGIANHIFEFVSVYLLPDLLLVYIFGILLNKEKIKKFLKYTQKKLYSIGS
ncbi:MAG: hypothetical protein AAF518_16330 [Spirochaetota bacterium]